MEVELSLGLENQEGSLDLKLKNCDSSVKDISIKLDGGASWLYQGYVSNISFFTYHFYVTENDFAVS